MIAVCVAAGWAVVGTTTHADDGPAPAFAIRLRVDPSIRPRRIAGDVMAETEAIWAPYGVRFEWAGPDSSPPAVGPVSFDVSLERRFEGPERLMWPPVMGHVVMKPDTPTWRPIHLSFDAIEKVLAERAPTGRASATALVLDHELARALGRVLAHEIGHVLIGAPDHDRAGLMRATLYAEGRRPRHQAISSDVQQCWPTDWPPSCADRFPHSQPSAGPRISRPGRNFWTRRLFLSWCALMYCHPTRALTLRSERTRMASSNRMTSDLRMLKSRLKTAWESGDYGVFAAYLEKGAIEFFDRLEIRPGTRLLDVACGAGQLAIPAARRGIQVTALDLATNLVRQARARAAENGLMIQVDEGDAEQLPYQDASFDVVLSLIGSMFAPRPELVASEMLRVCRPGGRIIMGNWTPEGHVGQMFRVIGGHVPPPRVVSPLLWGDEATCRSRFGGGVTDLKITRYLYPFEFPFAPAKVVDLLIEYYGPTNRGYASLDDDGRRALRDDLTALWARNNTATEGTTHVPAEYIEVVGTRS
jgi:SAM-dependent methyltransferase